MTADTTSKSSSALVRLFRKLKISPTYSTKEKEAATADHDHSKPSLSNPTETGNPPQGHYLWKVFDYFDQNGDRKISPAELQTCITSGGGSLSSDEAVAAVEACDIDGDGLLGFQEFQKLMMEVHPNDKNRELRDAFRMYEEREGSDSITPTSLKRMLSRLGQSRSIDECKAIIRTFDLNGDGLLSFHEFTIMMR